MKQAPFAIGLIVFILGTGSIAVPSLRAALAGLDSDHAFFNGGRTAPAVGRVVREAGGSGATGGLGIGHAVHDDGGKVPTWTEIKWPFLLDQWGVGKAWACSAADCGAQIEVYLRAKIGFCNCTTGVSDAAELERVADTDLMSETVKPIGPANPVRVRWMKGLSRAYQLSAQKPDEHVLSVAFNNECDVVVSLAAIGTADPAAVTPAIADFLNTPPVMAYVQEVLGIEMDHHQ